MGGQDSTARVSLRAAASALRAAGAAGAVSAVLIAAAGAHAQAAPTDASVGEVVVTATSVASVDQTPIIDTPRSVQAISSATILDIQPNSLQEVTKLFPTLTPRAAYSDPTQRIFARGINAAVTQRDGLELLDNFFPLEEVERIEVLQGVPDVTQGGDKTPGGVINFVPKRPLEQAFTRVTVGVNEYGNLLGQADANMRLGAADRFGLRVNVAGEHIQQPDDVDGRRYAVALALQAKLTPELTLDLNGSYTDQRRSGVNTGFFPLEDGVRLPRLSYGKDYGQSWSRDDFARGVVEAKLSGDLGDGWTLLAQAAYSHYDITEERPNYNNLTSSGSVSVDDQRDENPVDDVAGRLSITKALDLSSFAKTRLAVIGTAYDERSSYAYGDSPAGEADLYGDQRVARPAVDLPTPTLANTNRVYTIGFADETTLFERLTFTAGVQRYDAVAKSFDSGVLNTRVDLTKWLPSVSALYKVVPRWTVYATYNEAVEQGSLVYQPYANAGQHLPPLLSKTYEVGTKVQVASGLLATLSAFTFDRPAEVTVGDRLEQAGESRYRGFDASLSGRVTPRLTVRAGADYVDATVLRATDPTIIGKTPTNVPTFTTSFTAEYRFAEALYVSAGAFHTSRKPGDDANTFYVPGYATYDLGLRYVTAVAGRPTTLRVEATNITNRFYYAGTIFSSPEYGTPRFVKASLTTEF